MNEVKFPEIQALYDWGTNFAWVDSPFAVFLDLIGYGVDEYGDPVLEIMPALGHIECDYIADALKEYAKSSWQEVYEFVGELLNEHRPEESE